MCSLVPKPPRERPRAWSAPLYRAGGVLVGSDHGTVEDQPLQVGVLQRLEDPEPDPLGGPAIEPLPDRVPLAEAFGDVAPGGAGLADPEDGVDEETIVLGGDAGVAGPAGEEVFDPFPVFICYRVTMHGECSTGVGIIKSITCLTKIPQILSTRPKPIEPGRNPLMGIIDRIAGPIVVSAFLASCPIPSKGQEPPSSERSPAANSTEEADRLEAKAKLALEDGKNAERVKFLEAALAIRERLQGPDHLDTARCLQKLGSSYGFQHREKDAWPCLNRAARDSGEGLRPGSSPRRGDTRHDGRSLARK